MMITCHRGRRRCHCLSIHKDLCYRIRLSSSAAAEVRPGQPECKAVWHVFLKILLILSRSTVHFSFCFSAWMCLGSQAWLLFFLYDPLGWGFEHRSALGCFLISRTWLPFVLSLTSLFLLSCWFFSACQGPWQMLGKPGKEARSGQVQSVLGCKAG